jgi:hypothetical protein
MGGMRALDHKYGLNKPIELNETDWYPWGYRGDKIADSRVEAWEFIVGGGAGFNHLNGLYTPEDSAGKSPENDQLLGALANLKSFMGSFDFLRMRPDHAFLVDGLPASHTYYRAITEPGEQYALYIHHSSERRGSYVVAPGDYREVLALKLPPGSYQADWVDPASGSVISSERFTYEGGNRRMGAPTYTVDIALRIKRVK